MNKANGTAYLHSNEFHRLLKAECFGSDRVDYRIRVLVNRLGNQLRHILDVDGAEAVTAIIGDSKHRKAEMPKFRDPLSP